MKGKTSEKTVPLYYLSELKNVEEIRAYDRGGAALGTVYCYMDAISCNKCVASGMRWRHGRSSLFGTPEIAEEVLVSIDIFGRP
ncbi:hypothetical protein SADUNF_Sadunf13G0026200 [Salix dunnii]|uniref:Uncharacterized protein n=1 Tax=Salix dunnii TaxID=1413687 RepID=A0A835JII5_9ROSI|nr:hypothetical protein SADUNF_Sadunf13G0026200 [Salix dunnii]